MFTSSGLDYESSSRSSSESPVGDSIFQRSSSIWSYSSMSSTVGESQRDSFIPTITDVTTSSELKWMLQPTTQIPSLALSHSMHSPCNAKGRGEIIKMTVSKYQSIYRKGRMEQISAEEEEKRKNRRERNKMAAAKCRNKRKELTDSLQAEADSLEDEKSALQTEIANLIKDKEKLELILLAHQPICKIPSEKDDDSPMQTLSSDQRMQHPTSMPRNSHLEEMESVSPKASRCTFNFTLDNNSGCTLNMSDLDSSLEESLDLLESLTSTRVETSQAVPDIDLSGSLYSQDWEPLYTHAGGDSGALSTPVVTWTPSCTTYTSSFPFTYPEVNSLDTCRTAHRRESNDNGKSSNSLDSPTLLTL